MEEVELLAPAGDWDALLAVVNNGANAVYLGGSIFNARQYAGNFSDNELERAVQYCHVRSIKLYITLNTLIHQREIDEAARFISFLSKIGVDAIIIQDIGIARLVKELTPKLPMHGSAQMTINNTDGVKMLKQMDFSRIVLAREIPLEEIKSIATSCDMDLKPSFMDHCA
jgi:putative protease